MSQTLKRRKPNRNIARKVPRLDFIEEDTADTEPPPAAVSHVFSSTWNIHSSHITSSTFADAIPSSPIEESIPILDTLPTLYDEDAPMPSYEEEWTFPVDDGPMDTSVFHQVEDETLVAVCGSLNCPFL